MNNIDYDIQNDIQGNIHGDIHSDIRGDKRGDIIGLNEDDIVNFDSMIVGYIYIKKYGKKIWKKKYFVLNNNIFEYWKSNKKTNDGIVRIKEVMLYLNSTFELSCLKKMIYKNKIAWSFNIYKNNKLMCSFLSYNQRIGDIHKIMKKKIYIFT